MYLYLFLPSNLKGFPMVQIIHSRMALFAVARQIYRQQKLVRINPAKLDVLAATFDPATNKPADWNFYLPPALQGEDADPAAIFYIMTVISALQFCFWEKKADGSFTHWSYTNKKGESKLGPVGMTDLLLDAYADGKFPGVHLKAGDVSAVFPALLKGMPMARQRAAMLKIMAQAYRNGTLTDLVRALVDDGCVTEVASNMAHMMPTLFRDPFLRKAQLALGMTAQNLRSKGHNMDIELTAYADYRVPQVLRHYGVLEYAPVLAKQVDGQHILPANGEEEMAIRAAMLVATAYLAEKLNLTGPDVDSWLFMKTRQDAAFKANAKPFHLTVTTAY